MKNIDTENQAAFLKGLSALTRQYKITVGGCGCCGSPWLYEDKEIQGGEYELNEFDGKLQFTRGQRRD